MVEITHQDTRARLTPAGPTPPLADATKHKRHGSGHAGRPPAEMVGRGIANTQQQDLSPSSDATSAFAVSALGPPHRDLSDALNHWVIIRVQIHRLLTSRSGRPHRRTPRDTEHRPLVGEDRRARRVPQDPSGRRSGTGALSGVGKQPPR